jgi:hypothetical protein
MSQSSPGEAAGVLHESSVSDFVFPEVTGRHGVTVFRERAERTQGTGEVPQGWVIDGSALGGLVYSPVVRDFQRLLGFEEKGQFLRLPRRKLHGGEGSVSVLFPG